MGGNVDRIPANDDGGSDDRNHRGTLRIILGLHGYTGRPRQEIEKWRRVASSLDAIIVAPMGSTGGGGIRVTGAVAVAAGIPSDGTR
ncbi:hypothetical protein ACHAXA_005065 [Cyclostephanos tholiformis]|uniref:Uncharacterized protein n=1 Tax=Cyclostephanos tholiformis TaxID=382380 RepID=A0ABD3SRT4_9STRA